MANDEIVWDETPQVSESDIIWDSAPKTKTVKEVGQSKEQREFARQFIKSQGAFPKGLLEGVPIIGTPDKTEAYIRQAYGPEATAPTVAGAMAKGLGRLIKDPAGEVYDFAQNTGAGINRMVSLPYRTIRAATKYAQPGDVEAGEELRRLPLDLVKGATAPIGLYDIATGDLSFPAAREAWQQDPIGSILAAWGATKAVPSVAGKSLAQAGKAIAKAPQKTADYARGVVTGAISPMKDLRQSRLGQATKVNYDLMMKRNPGQVQKTFESTVDKLTPVENRMAFPENITANREKIGLALDEINDLERGGVAPPAGDTAVSHLQASNVAKQHIYAQEMQPLLQQSGRNVHMDNVRSYWRDLEQKWRAAGQEDLANAAAKKAAGYDAPLTPEGLQDRIAIQNNQLDFGTLATDNPPLANAMRGETKVLNQILNDHVNATVPGVAPDAFTNAKSRYGAQLTLQNTLVQNIINKLKKNNPEAAAGLSRLAAAEGAGGLLMANPKLLALGATTEMINLFRQNLRNVDTLVSRMARTKAALGRQPINRYQPTATMPPAARVPEPFNPEVLPGRDPYLGDVPLTPEQAASIKHTPPTVYDPTVGAEIPIKQNTKPYAKMTVQERKDMVRDLSNKYGLTMKEAADILREAGKLGKNSGL